MTEERLTELLGFVDGLASVSIESEERPEEGAEFVKARLTLADGEELTIPIIHYGNDDFVLTPWDWQGWTPDTAEEADGVKWRVNDTEREAVMLGGLPRIFAQ